MLLNNSISLQIVPLYFNRTVVADGGCEESQLYYTTPQANNQAENAGNAREIIDRTTANFLPGACRTGGLRRPGLALQKTQLCKGGT